MFSAEWKISLIVMAIVGKVLAVPEERGGSGTANYALNSVNYGGETSSSIFRGESSVNYGRSSSLTSSGFSRTTSSRGFSRSSSGGLGQNESPRPHNFNYQSADGHGNSHYHKEEADVSGTVRGSYGYTDFKGLYRVVDYIADSNGYRASIRTNEPGIDGKKSPADVEMIAEKPPFFILDQYTPYGGNKKITDVRGWSHVGGAVANTYQTGLNGTNVIIEPF